MNAFKLATVTLISSVALASLAVAGPLDGVYVGQPDLIGSASIDISAPNLIGSASVEISKPNLIGSVGIDIGGNPSTANSPAHGQGGGLNVSFVLKCEVAGSPSEFPDDIRIANAGLEAIPAGSTLKWRVNAARQSGFLRLNKTLAPGATIRADNVIEGGGVEAGAPCTVKLR
jgi:hypothetical protein